MTNPNFDAMSTPTRKNKNDKYPRVVWVANPELYASFEDKLRQLGIGKSTAISLLVNKWVSGKIKI